jgi:hypothetical protein
MTGFLRRLASGVLHSERAIHPAVGSMWSAQRVAEAIESSGENLVPPTRHADDPAPWMIQPIRDAMRGDAPHRAEPPTESRRNVAETAGFKPLVPLSQPNAASRTPDFARDHEAFVPTGPGAPREPAHSQPALHAQSSFLPIATSRIPAAPSPAGREAAPLSRPSQGAQPPASEHDAIEIHIGRIEVLAAPPPPAQPAPRPARKSLDLGEYLRRDGRTR